MGTGPPGCHFRPSQKGGDQVGLTRKGKGTKLMLVVDNQGTPLGALVASAQRAEITLAEATILEHSETGCGGGESSLASRNDVEKGRDQAGKLRCPTTAIGG